MKILLILIIILDILSFICLVNRHMLSFWSSVLLEFLNILIRVFTVSFFLFLGHLFKNINLFLLIAIIQQFLSEINRLLFYMHDYLEYIHATNNWFFRFLDKLYGMGDNYESR